MKTRFCPMAEWSQDDFRREVERLTKEALNVNLGLCVSTTIHGFEHSSVLVWVDRMEWDEPRQKWLFQSKGFAVNSRDQFVSLAEFQAIIRFWAKRAWEELKPVGLWETQDAYAFDRPEEVPA